MQAGLDQECIHGRGVGKAGLLYFRLGLHHLAARATDVRPCVAPMDHPIYGTIQNNRVGIEQQDILALGYADALIIRHSEATVCIVSDERDIGEFLRDH